MTKPRIGFLGTGWIGRHRMEAMVKTGAIEVAVIADPSAEMMAEAQRLAPDAKCVGSLEEILDLDVDGVVIATPSALHAEQSIQALTAGAAVFCQKPLGRNAAEARSVVDAARTADRLLGVDFSYRFTDGMQRIRSLLSEGALGQVFAVNLVFHNAYGPDKEWFYNPALSGGGCVMDLGVHLVDLALWAMNFPKVRQVSSLLHAGGRPMDGRSDVVEDYAAATLQLDGGTAVQLACSWRLQAGRDAIISAEFYGTEGGAALRNVNGSFYDFEAELYRGTSRETLSSPPEEWGGRAAADWAQRLAAGDRFDASAERLIDVSAALDRIYGR